MRLEKCACGFTNQLKLTGYLGQSQVECERCGRRGPLTRSDQLSAQLWNQDREGVKEIVAGVLDECQGMERGASMDEALPAAETAGSSPASIPTDGCDDAGYACDHDDIEGYPPFWKG